jgi:hypothetical protein
MEQDKLLAIVTEVVSPFGMSCSIQTNLIAECVTRCYTHLDPLADILGVEGCICVACEKARGRE